MTEIMAPRTEVRLAGEGGQGMILAGIILAEAAAIYDKKMAVQTQSYGPEARGGASKSEVVIADGEIDQRVINLAMGISVKVFRGENLHHFVNGIVFDEDPS